MSESQYKSEQYQETNQNIEKENNITSVNNRNDNINKNDQIINQNEGNKNEELKIGQYFLTPLESLLINKLMPHGFKFETEENILKLIENTKNQSKRNKQLNKYIDNSYKSNNNSNYEKKGHLHLKRRINQGINNIDDTVNNTNSEINKTTKKCKIGLQRIKDSQWVNTFYQSNNPDVPTLSKIENKLNNNEYTSFFDFAMDVRKIWSYFFNLGEKGDNDIYEKTSKMSEKWEKIYSELENSNDESYNMTTNIKKRTEKIQREYNEYKDQYSNRESVPPPVKKVNQQNNDNKPMTLEEKNTLGKLIRNLNKEQLRGIIKILTDNNDVMKSKYFEFDIDKLPIKKLRELEKYVKGCLSSNNPKNNDNIPHNVNNNNIINKKENHKNINNDINNNINNIQNQNKNYEQKNNNKEIKENQEKKQEPTGSTQKLKQSNKKTNNHESASLSDSDSISSDSSLSN